MRPRPTNHASLTDYLVRTCALRSSRVIEAFLRVDRASFVPERTIRSPGGSGKSTSAIVSGIEPGTVVVLFPSSDLSDGAAVVVR